MQIEREKWNTLKGALISTVVIGHFCQFISFNGEGGGYIMQSKLFSA